jgi:hypothetical protein
MSNNRFSIILERRPNGCRAPFRTGAGHIFDAHKKGDAWNMIRIIMRYRRRRIFFSPTPHNPACADRWRDHVGLFFYLSSWMMLWFFIASLTRVSSIIPPPLVPFNPAGALRVDLSVDEADSVLLSWACISSIDSYSIGLVLPSRLFYINSYTCIDNHTPWKMSS